MVTVPGRDELEWLDVTTRRSTSSTLVSAAASTAGYAVNKEETKQTMTYGNKKEIGQTSDLRTVLDARGHRHGELVLRAEADALTAASKHEECVLVARALREGRQFFLCVVLSEGLLTHLCCIFHSSDPYSMGVETGEVPTSRGQETSTQLYRRRRRRRRRVDELGQTLPILLFIWRGRSIEQDASRKEKERSKGCGRKSK